MAPRRPPGRPTGFHGLLWGSRANPPPMLPTPGDGDAFRNARWTTAAPPSHAQGKINVRIPALFGGHARMVCRPLHQEPIPADVPYLHANPVLAAAWNVRLAAVRHPRVGLCWRGSAGVELYRTGAASHTDQRSIYPPATLLPLVHTLAPTATLVSLQKPLLPGDRTTLPLLYFDDTLLASFEQTAALMANLDYVISIDTSIANLAGAMGLPGSVFVPPWPDRRWDGTWYPTLRIARCNQPHHWAPAVAAVARIALAELAAWPNLPAPRRT